MTKEEILKENLAFVDSTCFKEGHYNVILNAMQEYADQEKEIDLILLCKAVSRQTFRDQVQVLEEYQIEDIIEAVKRFIPESKIN